MTIGVGGKTYEEALDSLVDMSGGFSAAEHAEYQQRLERAMTLMKEQGFAAVYIHAGANFTYFTGGSLFAFERLVGVVLTADGQLEYIVPSFEKESLEESWVIQGNINSYHESYGTYDNFISVINKLGIADKKIGFDEAAPFFIFDGIKQVAPELNLVNGMSVTSACRMQKSKHELQLIKNAMEMTLAVHQATASMLHEGIKASTVKQFINDAHIRVGAPAGSFFVVVLFGANTAIVHGVSSEQFLKEGDMVLIDTGCSFHGYKSDITRSYVFGEPSEAQRTVWDHQKLIQSHIFDSIELGMSCGDLEKIMHEKSESLGYGPGYELPGIPHKVGHGIGMEVHERPHLMLNDKTPMGTGMCFSNEPTICVPGEFGVRLEDHFYTTEHGPEWFTARSHTIDNPFGI